MPSTPLDAEGVLFRGLRVRPGPNRSGTHIEDWRDMGTRKALGEASSDNDSHSGAGLSSSADAPNGLPHFLPELLVGDFCTDEYSARKAEQLKVARELWRVRRRIRDLEAIHAAEEAKAKAILTQSTAGGAGGPPTRRWTLAAPVEPLSALPPASEQDGLLEDLAMRAGLAALRAAALA